MANENMIRVNTRIPKYINEFLDQQAQTTGIPKSTQILLALDAYYNQKNVPNQIDALNTLLSNSEALNELIKKGE